jgi:predicted amidohydrolase
VPDGVLVLGFAEVAGDGELYNSAALFDRGELVAAYRKVHLWDSEQLFFRPGGSLPPVCDTSAGRIGVMVCYDLEFPEMTRSVALRGAELLAVPTNWPWLDRPDGAEAPEIMIAMGAARVNRMAIACCDRSGLERGQAWNEASAVIGPDGWIRARVDGGGCAVADLDLADSRLKTISPRNDVLADRRPDVYR